MKTLSYLSKRRSRLTSISSHLYDTAAAVPAAPMGLGISKIVIACLIGRWMWGNCEVPGVHTSLSRTMCAVHLMLSVRLWCALLCPRAAARMVICEPPSRYGRAQASTLRAGSTESDGAVAKRPALRAYTTSVLNVFDMTNKQRY